MQSLKGFPKNFQQKSAPMYSGHNMPLVCYLAEVMGIEPMSQRVYHLAYSYSLI